MEKKEVQATDFRACHSVVNCGKLTISSSTLLKGNIAFDATDIIETVFKGTNTNANISFRKCKFKRSISTTLPISVNFTSPTWKPWIKKILTFLSTRPPWVRRYS